MDELEKGLDLSRLSARQALRVRYDRNQKNLFVGEAAARIPFQPPVFSPLARLVRSIQALLGIEPAQPENTEVVDPAMPLVSLKDLLPDSNPDDISHIRWAFYYLKLHEPLPSDSSLEQVQGYLAAFEHFCQLQAWLQASELLLKPLKEGRLFHDWLVDEGYGPEAIVLYQTLLERVNPTLDAICWQGLGRAHYALRDYPTAIEAWQYYLSNRQPTDKTPVLERVYLPLGHAQYLSDDLDGAITTWSYCLSQLPEARLQDPQTNQAIPAVLYLGLAYFTCNQPAPACEALTAALPGLQDPALAEPLAEALRVLGTAEAQQDKPAAAIAAWEQLAALQDPTEPELLKNLGLAHAAVEQYAEAIHYLVPYAEDATVTADPATELAVLAALGTAYYETQALDEAIATLQAWAGQVQTAETALQGLIAPPFAPFTRPSDGQLYRMLGDAYYQQENYARAQPYLEQYRQTLGFEQDVKLLAQLGNCAQLLMDWPKVIEYLSAYQDQVSLDPESAEQATILYRLGSAYCATEQYAQAIDPLQAYLAHPLAAPPETIAPSQFALGKAAFLSQDYTTARKALQIYLEQEEPPEAPTALFYLGAIAAAQDEPQAAIQTLEQYLTLLGSGGGGEFFHQALFHLAMSYAHLEDYSHALEYFQKYFTLIQDKSVNVSREQFIEALYQAGQAYQFCGEYQSASAHLEELHKLAKQQDSSDLVDMALLNLGEIYLIIGRYNDAQTALNQALEKSQTAGQNKPVLKAKAMGRLGAVRCAQGKYDKGLSVCQKAMRLIRAIEDRSEEGQVINTLGTIYGRLKDPDRALSLFQQSWNIARSMDNQRAIAIALANLGITYGQLGNYTQAIKHLQQSLPMAQALGDRYEMGRILCALGENYGRLRAYSDAQDCLDHALQMAQVIAARPLEAKALYQSARLQAAHRFTVEALDACEAAIRLASEGHFPELETYRAFYTKLKPPLWRVVVNKVKRLFGRK
ncbi:MAG: tetratricopeptide repeat protein [Cyanobacteria bacterium P01_G01_bin.54]